MRLSSIDCGIINTLKARQWKMTGDVSHLVQVILAHTVYELDILYKWSLVINDTKSAQILQK